MTGNESPKFMRECLVRHLANLPRHEVDQRVNGYLAKHPKDKTLRDEVAVVFK